MVTVPLKDVFQYPAKRDEAIRHNNYKGVTFICSMLTTFSGVLLLDILIINE